MTEIEYESIIRDFVYALERKDIDRALGFFTNDATWITASGTFKGTKEIKNYIVWLVESLSDITFTDDGVGLIVQGTNAVYQHIFRSTFEGKKLNAPSVCTYQFSGNKCKNHWSISDRLLMAKQAAAGPIAKKAVNAIVNRMEKGLHQ